MPGRIPQSFIDDLLNRTDIVEVIDARVPLKKTGRDYSACCPFHNEKTPSFTVSQSKQFFHCFGCGAHGSAIGFLMDYDHLEFPEAVEELARMAGVEVPREAATGGPAQKREAGYDYYALLERADRWFRRQLREHPQAQRAVDYLRQRGLSGEIAARFGIGYAPPGWDGLAGELGDDAAATRAALELGLLVERDSGGHYDRFRDRVMFPIRDRRGRVVGFGGRVLGDEKPKYMNSPESPVFHKGRELYGLFEARKAQRKLERLLVVEGYMDVVALAQFGIDNAVATLGTATTSDHLERLFRVVPEVVFCFDGDAAGRKAAWRALENALPVMQQGRQARFLFLPEGEDPDTLVRKEGKELFLQRTVDSVPLSRFFFESLARQVDTGSMDGRARLAELARPLLQSMPDSLFRDMMVERLAELTRLDAGTLRTRLFGQAREAPAAGRRPGRQESSGRSPVRQAITLLLHHPQLARLPDLPDGWQGLDAPGVPLLVELLEFLRSRPHLKTGAILEHWRDRAEERHLARLAAVPPTVPETGLEQEFPGLLARLQEQQIARRTEELLAMSHGRALDDAEKAELKQLLAHGQPNRGETR